MGDLFEKCTLCDARGTVPAETKTGVPFSRICPACKGVRFVKIGLTVRQVVEMQCRLKALAELDPSKLYRPCTGCAEYRRLGNVLAKHDACNGLGFIVLPPEKPERPVPKEPWSIERVKREEGGRFCVTFVDSWDGGNWLGVYNAEGYLIQTIWTPSADVPRLDPSELGRLADAVAPEAIQA